MVDVDKQKEKILGVFVFKKKKYFGRLRPKEEGEIRKCRGLQVEGEDSGRLRLQEEDEDFQDTLRLIKKIKFINSYSFIFSARPGTVAAKLDLIDKNKSQERLEIIQKKLLLSQKHIQFF